MEVSVEFVCDTFAEDNDLFFNTQKPLFRSSESSVAQSQELVSEFDIYTNDTKQITPEECRECLDECHEASVFLLASTEKPLHDESNFNISVAERPTLQEKEDDFSTMSLLNKKADYPDIREIEEDHTSTENFLPSSVVIEYPEEETANSSERRHIKQLETDEDDVVVSEQVTEHVKEGIFTKIRKRKVVKTSENNNQITTIITTEEEGKTPVIEVTHTFKENKDKPTICEMITLQEDNTTSSGIPEEPKGPDTMQENDRPVAMERYPTRDEKKPETSEIVPSTDQVQPKKRQKKKSTKEPSKTEDDEKCTIKTKEKCVIDDSPKPAEENRETIPLDVATDEVVTDDSPKQDVSNQEPKKTIAKKKKPTKHFKETPDDKEEQEFDEDIKKPVLEKYEPTPFIPKKKKGEEDIPIKRLEKHTIHRTDGSPKKVLIVPVEDVPQLAKIKLKKIKPEKKEERKFISLPKFLLKSRIIHHPYPPSMQVLYITEIGAIKENGILSRNIEEAEKIPKRRRKKVKLPEDETKPILEEYVPHEDEVAPAQKEVDEKPRIKKPGLKKPDVNEANDSKLQLGKGLVPKPEDSVEDVLLRKATVPSKDRPTKDDESPEIKISKKEDQKEPIGKTTEKLEPLAPFNIPSDEVELEERVPVFDVLPDEPVAKTEEKPKHKKKVSKKLPETLQTELKLGTPAPPVPEDEDDISLKKKQGPKPDEEKPEIKLKPFAKEKPESGGPESDDGIKFKPEIIDHIEDNAEIPQKVDKDKIKKRPKKKEETNNKIESLKYDTEMADVRIKHVPDAEDSNEKDIKASVSEVNEDQPQIVTPSNEEVRPGIMPVEKSETMVEEIPVDKLSPEQADTPKKKIIKKKKVPKFDETPDVAEDVDVDEQLPRPVLEEYEPTPFVPTKKRTEKKKGETIGNLTPNVGEAPEDQSNETTELDMPVAENVFSVEEIEKLEQEIPVDITSPEEVGKPKKKIIKKKKTPQPAEQTDSTLDVDLDEELPRPVLEKYEPTPFVPTKKKKDKEKGKIIAETEHNVEEAAEDQQDDAVPHLSVPGPLIPVEESEHVPEEVPADETSPDKVEKPHKKMVKKKKIVKIDEKPDVVLDVDLDEELPRPILEKYEPTPFVPTKKKKDKEKPTEDIKPDFGELAEDKKEEFDVPNVSDVQSIFSVVQPESVKEETSVDENTSPNVETPKKRIIKKRKPSKTDEKPDVKLDVNVEEEIPRPVLEENEPTPLAPTKEWTEAEDEKPLGEIESNVAREEQPDETPELDVPFEEKLIPVEMSKKLEGDTLVDKLIPEEVEKPKKKTIKKKKTPKIEEKPDVTLDVDLDEELPRPVLEKYEPTPFVPTKKKTKEEKKKNFENLEKHSIVRTEGSPKQVVVVPVDEVPKLAEIKLKKIKPQKHEDRKSVSLPKFLLKSRIEFHPYPPSLVTPIVTEIGAKKDNGILSRNVEEAEKLTKKRRRKIKLPEEDARPELEEYTPHKDELIPTEAEAASPAPRKKAGSLKPSEDATGDTIIPIGKGVIPKEEDNVDEVTLQKVLLPTEDTTSADEKRPKTETTDKEKPKKSKEDKNVALQPFEPFDIPKDDLILEERVPVPEDVPEDILLTSEEIPKQKKKPSKKTPETVVSELKPGVPKPPLPDEETDINLKWKQGERPKDDVPEVQLKPFTKELAGEDKTGKDDQIKFTPTEEEREDDEIEMVVPDLIDKSKKKPKKKPRTEMISEPDLPKPEETPLETTQETCEIPIAKSQKLEPIHVPEQTELQTQEHTQPEVTVMDSRVPPEESEELVEEKPSDVTPQEEIETPKKKVPKKKKKTLKPDETPDVVLDVDLDEELPRPVLEKYEPTPFVPSKKRNEREKAKPTERLEKHAIVLTEGSPKMVVVVPVDQVPILAEVKLKKTKAKTREERKSVSLPKFLLKSRIVHHPYPPALQTLVFTDIGAKKDNGILSRNVEEAEKLPKKKKRKVKLPEDDVKTELEEYVPHKDDSVPAQTEITVPQMEKPKQSKPSKEETEDTKIPMGKGLLPQNERDEDSVSLRKVEMPTDDTPCADEKHPENKTIEKKKPKKQKKNETVDIEPFEPFDVPKDDVLLEKHVPGPEDVPEEKRPTMADSPKEKIKPSKKEPETLQTEIIPGVPKPLVPEEDKDVSFKKRQAPKPEEEVESVLLKPFGIEKPEPKEEARKEGDVAFQPQDSDQKEDNVETHAPTEKTKTVKKPKRKLQNDEKLPKPTPEDLGESNKVVPEKSDLPSVMIPDAADEVPLTEQKPSLTQPEEGLESKPLVVAPQLPNEETIGEVDKKPLDEIVPDEVESTKKKIVKKKKKVPKQEDKPDIVLDVDLDEEIPRPVLEKYEPTPFVPTKKRTEEEKKTPAGIEKHPIVRTEGSPTKLVIVPVDEVPKVAEKKLKKSKPEKREDRKSVSLPKFLLKSRIQHHPFPPAPQNLLITEIGFIKDNGVLSRNIEEAKKVPKKRIKKVKLPDEPNKTQLEEYVPYKDDIVPEEKQTEKDANIAKERVRPTEEATDDSKIPIGKGVIPKPEDVNDVVSLRKVSIPSEDATDTYEDIPKSKSTETSTQKIERKDSPEEIMPFEPYDVPKEDLVLQDLSIVPEDIQRDEQQTKEELPKKKKKPLEKEPETMISEIKPGTSKPTIPEEEKVVPLTIQQAPKPVNDEQHVPLKPFVKEVGAENNEDLEVKLLLEPNFEEPTLFHEPINEIPLVFNEPTESGKSESPEKATIEAVDVPKPKSLKKKKKTPKSEEKPEFVLDVDLDEELPRTVLEKYEPTPFVPTKKRSVEEKKQPLDFNKEVSTSVVANDKPTVLSPLKNDAEGNEDLPLNENVFGESKTFILRPKRDGNLPDLNTPLDELQEFTIKKPTFDEPTEEFVTLVKNQKPVEDDTTVEATVPIHPAQLVKDQSDVVESVTLKKKRKPSVKDAQEELSVRQLQPKDEGIIVDKPISAVQELKPPIDVDDEQSTTLFKKVRPEEKDDIPENTVSIYPSQNIEDQLDVDAVTLIKKTRPSLTELGEELLIRKFKPKDEQVTDEKHTAGVEELKPSFEKDEDNSEVKLVLPSPQTKARIISEESVTDVIPLLPSQEQESPEETAVIVKRRKAKTPHSEEFDESVTIMKHSPQSPDASEKIHVLRRKEKEVPVEADEVSEITISIPDKVEIHESEVVVLQSTPDEIEPDDVTEKIVLQKKKPRGSLKDEVGQEITIKKPALDEPEEIETVTFKPKVTKKLEDVEQEFKIQLQQYEEEEISMSGKVRLKKPKTKTFAEEAGESTIRVEQELPEDSCTVIEEIIDDDQYILPKDQPESVEIKFRRKPSVEKRYSVEDIAEDVLLGLRLGKRESVIYEEETLAVKLAPKRKPSKPSLQTEKAAHMGRNNSHLQRVHAAQLFSLEDVTLSLTKESEALQEEVEPTHTEVHDGDILYSISSYVAENEDALSLVEGERVYILECHNSDWWFVRKNLTAEKGWVPSKYLKDENTYTDYLTLKLHEKIDKLPVFEKAPLGKKGTAPCFAEKLQPQHVPDGATVQLECRVEGSPKPQITWFRETAIIKPSADFQMYYDEDNVATLVIREVFPEDAGFFTCVAKNSCGFASSTTEIYVEAPLSDHGSDITAPSRKSMSRESSLADILEGIPPTFSRKPKAKCVAVGEDVELECRLVAIPEPDITWLFSGKHLTSEKNVTVTTDSDMHMYSSIVRISSVQKSQEGSYTIIAKNREGEATMTITVKVKTGEKEGPQILEPLKSVHICEGDSAVFSTQIVGTPTPKVTWYKDGKPAKKLPVKSDGDTYTLTLIQPKPADSAQYTVKAVNEVGSCETTATLVVEELPRPEPPMFVERFQEQKVRENDTITLLARVTGNPTPQITWFKNNEPLQQSSRVKEKFDGTTVVLEVTGADSELDAGDYKCLASNPSGKASHGARVTVDVDKVTFTRKLQKSLVVDERSPIKLECETSHIVSTRWFLNGKELSGMDHREVIQENKIHRLFIKQSSTLDAGTFTCKVKEQSTDCKVTVNETKAEFVRKVEDIEVKEREIAVLEVEISSPTAEVTWHKDGEQIKEAKDKVVFEKKGGVRRLLIRSTSVHDEGEYTCSLGDNECSAEVTVVELPPEIITKLKDTTVPRGDRATLEIELTKGDALVRWFKDGKELQFSEHVQLAIDGKRQKLKIYNAEPEDAGVYSCQVGDQTSSGRLSVEEPDIRFITRLPDVTKVPVGTDATFTVELSHPNFDVKWFRKSKELKETDRYTFFSEGVIRKLVVKKVITDDETDYSCVLLNAKTSSKLEVEVVETIPKIDVPRNEFKVKKGDDITMEVNFSSRPAPEDEWTVSGKLIKKSKRVIPNLTESSASLTIKKVEDVDAGRYTIKLKNKSGEASADLTLIIFESPSAPGSPEVLEVTDDSVTLHWKAPEHDGNSPICEYILEYHKKGEFSWTNVCKDVRITETTHRVSKLTTDDELTFRVLAVNEAGPGEPSPATRFIRVARPKTAEPPVILEPLKDQTAGLGKTANLECVISGTPVPEVKWLKNGTIIKEKTISYENRVAKYTINKTSEKSAGNYVCQAKNEAGTAETSCNLSIQDIPTVEVDDTLVSQRLNVNEKWKVEARFTGYPHPEVVWSKNGKTISSNKTTVIHTDSFISTIATYSVSRECSGKYSITVSNDAGVAEKSIELRVIDKPGKPEGPMEVKEVSKESVTIGWKPPVDDGGIELSKYSIEKCDTKRMIWTKVADVDKDVQMYCVQQLQEDAEYMFRVFAQNPVGLSEPLESPPVTPHSEFEKPSAPRGPFEVSSMTDTSFTLKWQPPESDGGSQILEYLVEKREVSKKAWQKVGTSGGDVAFIDVTGLKATTAYNFRVTASNIVGSGPPYAPEEPITAGKMISPFKGSVTSALRLKVMTDDHRPDEDEDITTVTLPPPKPRSKALALPTQAPRPSLVILEPSFEDGGVPPSLLSPALSCLPAELHSSFSSPMSLLDCSADAFGQLPERKKSGSSLDFSVRKVSITGSSGLSRQGSFAPTNLPVTTELSPSYLVIENRKDSFASEYEVMKKRPSVAKLINTSKIKEISGEGLRTILTFFPVSGGEEKAADSTKGTKTIPSKLTTRQRTWPPVNATNQKEPNQNLPESIEKKPREKPPPRILLPPRPISPFKQKVTASPSAPTNLTVSDVTSRSVTIQWGPPENLGGTDLTGYIVERQDAGSKKWVKVVTLEPHTVQFCIENLKEKSEMLLRVVAENAVGLSPPASTEPISLKTHATPPSPPTAPLEVRAVGPYAVIIEWGTPESDGGSPLTGYTIAIRDSRKTMWMEVGRVKADVQKLTIKDLQENHEYLIRIFARNEVGPSEPLESEEPFKVLKPSELDSADLERAEATDKDTPSISFSTETTTSWLRDNNMDADIDTYAQGSLLRRDEYFFRIWCYAKQLFK